MRISRRATVDRLSELSGPDRPPRQVFGPTLVVTAAMLWGTDGLWRTGLLAGLAAPSIVLWEHVLLVGATGWLVWRERRILARLGGGDRVTLVVIGVGASAVATILFTQAFRHASPTTVVLLQKVQPLIAISLAALWLREPLPRRFWPLLPLALAGTYLISFGDTGPLASIATAADRPLGAAMAVGAAVLWGAGTVLGRRMLTRLSFATLAAVRFAVALPALVVIALATGPGVPTASQLPGLVLLALVAGLAGMLIYYRGLRETPAAIATLCELSFPVTAIFVNFLFLGTPVTVNQIAGVAALWSAIALMRHGEVPADRTRVTSQAPA